MPSRGICFVQSVAVIVAVLLGGCIGPSVRIDPPALPGALVASLPLRIGVFIPPEARSYAFKDEAGTGSRFKVGPASTETLLWAFRAGFDQVVSLDAPSAAGTAGVDAIATLEGIDWAVDSAGGLYTTQARYEFALWNPDGSLVARWVTEQRVGSDEAVRDPGESEPRRLSELLEVPSVMVLEKVAAALLLELREQPPIRAWLESHQAYAQAMPEPGPVAATVWPSLPGIHVASDAASGPVRRCLIKQLRERLPERPVLTDPDIRQALFPWFSDSPAVATAATRLEELARYLPAVTRFNELGLGTIILVTGGTKQDWHGGGFCGGGYGGGGCLGFMWGTRDSVIAARLIDLSQPHALAESEAHESGTAVLPMFVLPLPFIPATRTAACHELGKALAERLR